MKAERIRTDKKSISAEQLKYIEANEYGLIEQSSLYMIFRYV